MSYEQARALMGRGVSRPTLFAIRFPNLISRQTNDYLNFFCKATAIPEIRTATAFANGHERMGISREQPTAIQFGKPFNIEVIENSDFRVYREMRRWFDQTAQDINGLGSQRMNYYNTFVQDMELIKLEQPGNLEEALGSIGLITDYKRVLTVRFRNAYPINIGTIALDQDNTNSFTTFGVSFTYESYSVDTAVSDIIGQLATDVANTAIDAIL